MTGPGPELTVAARRFDLAAPFAIARGTRRVAETVEVALHDGQGHVGRGESVPYGRYGESVAGVVADIQALAPEIAAGLGRAGIQDRLPAGAARNALDLAFWDLEAGAAGRPVWDLAGLDRPTAVPTAMTVSLDRAPAMAAAAGRLAAQGWPLLKLKLTGAGDMARLAAVRAAAPAVRIIVDANESWPRAELGALAAACAAHGVSMIEQPLPAGADDALAGADLPLPVYADESCHDRAGLARLAELYDGVNIKLDKTGGLTEALALRAAARARGLSVMVGCMVASSLALAPAVLLAQGAAVADLDGFLWLAADRRPGLETRPGEVAPPAPELWG